MGRLLSVHPMRTLLWALPGPSGPPPHSQSLPGRQLSQHSRGLQQEGERESSKQGSGARAWRRTPPAEPPPPPCVCSCRGPANDPPLLGEVGVSGHWAQARPPTQPLLLGCPWGLQGSGTALVPAWPSERSPSPALSVCVQWLQQIEETESALHRKMVDLETEKVGGRLASCVQHDVTGWVPEAETRVLLCFRSCSVSRRATWTRSWITGSSPWTRLTG